VAALEIWVTVNQEYFLMNATIINPHICYHFAGIFV